MNGPIPFTRRPVRFQEEKHFNIYHDESGTDPKRDRFMFHGALFVPQGQWRVALRILNSARVGYEGQIHFSDLRDNTTNPKAQIARTWLHLYGGNLSRYCFFKCMIVDLHSRYFKDKRYPERFYLYNYTAMQAVYSGIAWSLADYAQVTLSIYSEQSSRSPKDNFTTYLPREIGDRAFEKHVLGDGKCPEIAVSPDEVVLVNGNPRKVERVLAGHCEFIQLTDLLTSTIAEAVNARASQGIKLDLAQLVAQWIEDTRLPPWLQGRDLHRRFSVSCFPDANGQFYDCPLAIRSA